MSNSTQSPSSVTSDSCSCHASGCQFCNSVCVSHLGQMDIPSTPDPFEMYGSDPSKLEPEAPVEQAFIPHIAVRPVILTIAGDFNGYQRVKKPKHVSLVDALGLGDNRTNVTRAPSNVLTRSTLIAISSDTRSPEVPRVSAVDVSVQCDNHVHS